MKRIFDIFGSILGIIIFCPLMILVALLIKWQDSGPAIFSQPRIGKKGKIFCLYKFRTMMVGAEEVLQRDSKLMEEYIKTNFSLPLEKDPRVTAIGRFLRRSSLDELPQLFNVLKGDMSLVGPRPIVREEIVHYKGVEDAFFSIRPGLTGYWQVCGRDNIAYPQRVSVEMYYVENRSFIFDLKILIKTVGSVISSKGVN